MTTLAVLVVIVFLLWLAYDVGFDNGRNAKEKGHQKSHYVMEQTIGGGYGWCIDCAKTVPVSQRSGYEDFTYE